MSRLTGDRNLQQQTPQPIQPVIQNLQLFQQSVQVSNTSNQDSQVVPQQQILTIPSNSSYNSFIIINNNSSGNNSDGILRPQANINTIQGSIFYSSSSATSLVVNQNPTANVASVPFSHVPPSSSLNIDTKSPTVKKRIKLDIPDITNNCENSTENFSGLKKRILEHKLQRLKCLKEKYAKIFFQVDLIK